MAWQMIKIANGHNSLDNSELESGDMFPILNQLKDHFQERFDKSDKFGLSFAAVGVDILIDGARLTVGWDNWSGLFIMARDDDGDKIVMEIAEFFDAGS